MKIWKYPLEVVPQQIIEMPIEAKILTVQVQQKIPCIWALVNPGVYLTKREIRIVGTGHKFDDSLATYIGTFQQLNGALVWHVFEVE